MARVTLLKDGPESRRIRYPFQQATFLVQGHYRISADMQVATTGLRRAVQQFVDHGIEIHETRIFAEVVVRLAEKRVLLAVRS